MAPGATVAQVVVAVKSVDARMERMWRVEVPVLVRVTFCAEEALPMVVLGKVSELWDSWKVARTDELVGELERIGTAVPVRSRVLGLEEASLSRMRVPTSARAEVSVELVGSSSMGA